LVLMAGYQDSIENDTRCDCRWGSQM